MLSMEDCLAYCELTEEEILAIAEHEHIPEMNAIAYGEYLMHLKDGSEQVYQIIVDDIREAQRRRDCMHVRNLLHVLHHFLKAHPEAMPKVHPWSKAA